MKTRHAMTSMFLAGLALLAWLCAGCAKLGGMAASKPSDDKGLLVMNAATAQVMGMAIAKGERVGISSLESVPEGGYGAYTKMTSYLIGPDGKPATDKTGNIIPITTEMITKAANIQFVKGMENLEEAEYTLNGYDYVKDLPPELKNMVSGMPACQLKLKLRGVQGMGVQEGVIAGSRRAGGDERAAIFAGLAQLAAANGAAFAVKVTALADGLTKVVTATGKEIVGRVSGSYYVDAAVAGAGKITEAVLKERDGTVSTVWAEGAEASALTAARKMAPNAADPRAADVPAGTAKLYVQHAIRDSTGIYSVSASDGHMYTGKLLSKAPMRDDPSVLQVVIETSTGTVALYAAGDRAGLFAE